MAFWIMEKSFFCVRVVKDGFVTSPRVEPLWKNHLLIHSILLEGDQGSTPSSVLDTNLTILYRGMWHSNDQLLLSTLASDFSMIKLDICLHQERTRELHESISFLFCVEMQSVNVMTKNFKKIKAINHDQNGLYSGCNVAMGWWVMKKGYKAQKVFKG